MSYVHLIHNGYTIDHFNSEEEARNEIHHRLVEHRDLKPTLVLDQVGEYTPRYGDKTKCRTLVYRYNTIYMETFLIIDGDL